MTHSRILSCLVVPLLLVVKIQCYQVPEATLIAYKPKGLQVSIPDSDGIQIFAFHGNVNKEIVNREAGEMSVDIFRSKNGRWTYENPRIRLKEGDVINYWLYVQMDGLGYPKDDLTWTVTTLVNKDGSTPPKPTPPTPPPTPPAPPVTCQQSVTTVNGVHKCEKELVFEETFDNLQRPKWENVVQFGGDPGYPFVLYTDKPENNFVSNGFLHIKPSLQPDDTVTSGLQNLNGCTGIPNSDDCNRHAGGGFYIPPALSAQLRTKQSFNFRYGKVEIRAKMPLGDWIFSEIQLKPKQLNIYGSSPKLASGQINLALVKGNRNLVSNGQQIGASCLESNCEIALNDMYHREDCNETRQALWGGAFHTYGLMWTPDFIAFSINGNEIGKVVPPNNGFQSMAPFNELPTAPWSKGTKMAPFDQEFYVSLGLGVGGFTEFPDNSVSTVQVSPTNINYEKPWINKEAKAIAKFWNKKDQWYPTWNDDSTLQVDYVRVWAL